MNKMPLSDQVKYLEQRYLNEHLVFGEAIATIEINLKRGTMFGNKLTDDEVTQAKEQMEQHIVFWQKTYAGVDTMPECFATPAIEKAGGK